MKRLLTTTNDYALTFARLALGVMILAHGSQKMLGLFGGQGFSATMETFTGKLGIPPLLAFLAIVAEFFGGLGLIFGALSRVAAFGVGAVMAVAMLKFHLPHGFFMNWFGNQQGEGIEFFILALGLAAAVMIRGGGALSVDGFIASRMAARATETYGKAVVAGAEERERTNA